MLPRARSRSRRGLPAEIAAELLAALGKPADIGGYYLPDDAKCAAAMRPGVRLNAIIKRL